MEVLFRWQFTSIKIGFAVFVSILNSNEKFVRDTFVLTFKKRIEIRQRLLCCYYRYSFFVLQQFWDTIFLKLKVDFLHDFNVIIQFFMRYGFRSITISRKTDKNIFCLSFLPLSYRTDIILFFFIYIYHFVLKYWWKKLFRYWSSNPLKGNYF